MVLEDFFGCHYHKLFAFEMIFIDFHIFSMKPESKN